jgi:hypothetical protein
MNVIRLSVGKLKVDRHSSVWKTGLKKVNVKISL